MFLDEFYLREWAVKLDIPILSIDYSLAPKAPFPRAFEEVFYVYCWILKNVELLGSTGENIVFAGDSAGGNLNTACVVKCIEMGIKLPIGLFNAYTPFLVNFASTPARFLSLVDPLLPYGFLMRIFKSYGSVDLEKFDNETKAQKIPPPLIITSESNQVVDVFDDNRDENEDKSHENKALEVMWHKIKDGAEPDWHSNLGSIRETPSEEPASPFHFPSNVDDDGGGLFMRTPTKEVKDDPMQNASITAAKNDLGSRTNSEENLVVDVSKDALSASNFQEKFHSAKTSFVNAITMPFRLKSPEDKLAHLIPTAAPDEFVFSVPKNQYLSPYWASDEVLRLFPPTKIVTTIVDPCVDDCVEFSKKLRHLGVDIQLDIIEGLNHGFLNFAQVNELHKN